MFDPLSSIRNLDEVKHDFNIAKKSCVKLSGLSFVLFHQGPTDHDHEKFQELRETITKMYSRNPLNTLDSFNEVRILTPE